MDYHNSLSPFSYFFLLGLEENKRLLTGIRKAEQEELETIEENTKLKDQITGSKICFGLLI